ncbi:MAG: ABC transporter ATP-binding protein [Blastocatellia bacterium]|nr:ABC transporter ATP-binding protein [Blastocatellia bacterium]
MPDKTYSHWEIVKRFLPFARAYTGKYILAIFLLIITSLLSLLPPILLKFIIDDAIKNTNLALLNKVALSITMVILLSGMTKSLMEYIHEWVSAHFIFDLRRYLYNHIQSQSMDFFSSVKIGEILGRLRTDITSVYGVLVNTLLGSLSEVVQILGITAILLYLNVKLAVIALAFIPPLYFLLTHSGKALRSLSKDTRDKDVALLEFFQEKLSNIQIIKLFHREKHEDEKHSVLGEEYISSSLKRLRFKFTSTFIVGFLTSIASVVVIWYGGYKVIGGTLSSGSLIAFYLYTVRLYGPIQSLANRGIEIYNGLASADKLIEYLDLKPKIEEVENPVRLKDVAGKISFKNISFKYPTSQSLVIDGLTLDISPGQKVALVGSSGAGKSTLANLICRLYDVEIGSIEIDDRNIKQLELKSLYDAVGIVSQDTYLFNATIEENIKYGRVEASFEEVIDAAKKAHLHDFIEKLPDGYKTVVGSRGVKLSGGQRQRIALARMILKDAKIWILDEFTSSLDSRSEAVVYDNIKPLIEDRTTLIIAHRFSTILSADQVVVLQGGKIVEIGTHTNLYNKDGIYRKLFDTQFKTVAVSG